MPAQAGMQSRLLLLPLRKTGGNERGERFRYAAAARRLRQRRLAGCGTSGGSAASHTAASWIAGGSGRSAQCSFFYSKPYSMVGFTTAKYGEMSKSRGA